jgi:DNA-binding MarR family transcriptional regulator
VAGRPATGDLGARGRHRTRAGAHTTSTLVTKLVANGLLIRTVDDADRRACQLRLAEPTQQIVDASRAARRVLLSEVLEELDNDQIDSLTKGLEVLNTVTRRLQERGS